MIGTRTPLRISFFGGGTDFPEVYREIGGAVFSTTINRYIYIFLNKKTETQGITAKYSKLENVVDSQEITHPIIRELLTAFRIENVDISVSADVPAGTGMGSSSSFTVGLINACASYLSISMSALQMSEMACNLEMVKLGESIGKQDAYAGGMGGLNLYEFSTSGKVRVSSANLDLKSVQILQNSIRLISIGSPRNAASILKKQVEEVNADRRVLRIYEEMKSQAIWASELKSLDLIEFGGEVDRAWSLKKEVNSSVSNNEVELLYKEGKKAGAAGGKLLGAGKSGYIMFIVPPSKLENFELRMNKYKPRPVQLDNAGTTLILKDLEK